MKRTRGRALVVALLAAVACGAAAAQGYPVKPVRMILPFPPGSPSDMVGRTLAQKLAEQLGQPIVPDNRVGAGGNVGLGAVAKSPPDGYTILISSPAIALSPALYASLTYNAARDLAPVARVASIENVMLVHPSVPAKTVKQFIALARAQPGKLNFGSGGPGTTNHLANELLKYNEKIDMVHIPYKGAALAATALAGGEVDQVIVAVAPALPLIRAGRVRPLAVLSEKREPTLPDVPTTTEAGYPNFRMSIWYGLFAPAGIPRDILAQLSRETATALESAALRERMIAAGMNPWPGSAEDMASLVKSETARYATIVRSAGLKPQ